MINLSVDTRNLSHTMSEEHLEEVYEEMMALVESSFDVNVEEISGETSFWVPTPEDEIEELELFGIIEIADDVSTFEKIIHLTHEVGHIVYYMDELFKNTKDTMFHESLAWYLGYHFMAEHGYKIEISEYEQHMSYALKLYRWSENARDDE
jgi:hypothetical protein